MHAVYFCYGEMYKTTGQNFAMNRFFRTSIPRVPNPCQIQPVFTEANPVQPVFSEASSPPGDGAKNAVAKTTPLSGLSITMSRKTFAPNSERPNRKAKLKSSIRMFLPGFRASITDRRPNKFTHAISRQGILNYCKRRHTAHCILYALKNWVEGLSD